VNLVFYRGAEIPDPHRILKGTGKKMRHIRFNSLATYGTDTWEPTSARLSCRSGQRLRNPRDETSDAATLNWAPNCIVLGHLQGDPT
jgi:hypothetical protein